ncbi:MAG: hypothetical protein U0X86_000642 [Wolbachia endosymbiont of Xenopsylla cheopis]
MWKRFKNFIFSLVRLLSFKKGKNVYSNIASNSNTSSQDEIKSQDTALEIVNNRKSKEKDDGFYDALSEEDWKKQDEHKINVLLKYTTNEVDRNYIKENSDKFLNASPEEEHEKLNSNTDLSEGDDIFYDAETYKNDKFYNVNGLQEVTKFTDHENTFAAAMFECSVDKQSRNNNDGYQLTRLELKSDKDSRGCTLNFQNKQSSIKFSSDHLRLYMPFFFADKKQMSIDELFQYEKNDTTSTPGIVILLEKPDSINLNPNFVWNFIYNKVWGMIKDGETKKSTEIPKALFPTFTVELEEQNINFSIDKNAIPQSMEDLKDEKPTIGKILQIPGASSLVTEIISNILDKITNKVEKTSFRIKNVLICGKIINELQVQNSIAKEDEQNTKLSQATVSCINPKEAKL